MEPFMALFKRSRKGPDYELLPTASQHHDPPEKAPWIQLYCSRPAKRLTAAFVALVLTLMLLSKYMHTRWRGSNEEGFPDYQDIWQLERRLPQHKMKLPFPEGYYG